MPFCLQPHETWNIFDSSKIQTMMECPRKYFYEYILGWRTDSPKHDLEFGTALHLAMEQLMTGGYSSQSQELAYTAFLKEYRKSYGPECDLLPEHGVKNPSNVLRMLGEYCLQYQGDAFKPLYTEIAGTVPINDLGDCLHFRIDSIVKDSDGVAVWDHKSCSELSRVWMDQWNLSFQVGTYTHVLYCLYPQDEVYGCRINALCFGRKPRKDAKSAPKEKPFSFMRLPVRRTPEAMNVWLWLANHWLSAIKEEMQALLASDPEDHVMRAFPLNTTACTKYWGCQFMPFCSAWANPLAHCADIPVGFKQEWWNPCDQDKTAKAIFDMEKSIIKTQEPLEAPEGEGK